MTTLSSHASFKELNDTTRKPAFANGLLAEF